MNTKTIVRVNNVDIIATSDEQLIAIRPICEALGIDYSRQLKKIKDEMPKTKEIDYIVSFIENSQRGIIK